jgi:LmbE family N-acetylglucosaminyl deacetylase
MIRNAAEVSGLGTILGIWAHPDDEAYLSGGLMALATDAGSRVVCATATRGELGPRNVRPSWPAACASSASASTTGWGTPTAVAPQPTSNGPWTSCVR